MVNPINLRIKTENIKRSSPAIAAVRSSRPAWSFLGSPADVVIINPAYKIRRKAIPPPIPIPQLKIKAINSCPSPIGIQPMAVARFPLPGFVVVLAGSFPTQKIGAFVKLPGVKTGQSAEFTQQVVGAALHRVPALHPVIGFHVLHPVTRGLQHTCVALHPSPPNPPMGVGSKPSGQMSRPDFIPLHSPPSKPHSTPSVTQQDSPKEQPALPSFINPAPQPRIVDLQIPVRPVVSPIHVDPGGGVIGGEGLTQAIQSCPTLLTQEDSKDTAQSRGFVQKPGAQAAEDRFTRQTPGDTHSQSNLLVGCAKACLGAKKETIKNRARMKEITVDSLFTKLSLAQEKPGLVGIVDIMDRPWV